MGLPELPETPAAAAIEGLTAARATFSVAHLALAG